MFPMYGIDENGVHQSEWAFTDVDAAPTKSYIIENREDENVRPYFDAAFAKIPAFLFYDVKNDPYCLNNLADNPDFHPLKEEMKDILMKELEKSGDSRMVGSDPEVFDSYPRYSPMREFPEPNISIKQK
jgi:N-sulfoglucosamine sulfohydrolase